ARRAATDEAAVDEELVAAVDGDRQRRRVRRGRKIERATKEEPAIAPVVAPAHAAEELVPVAEWIDRLAGRPDEGSASVHQRSAFGAGQTERQKAKGKNQKAKVGAGPRLGTDQASRLLTIAL